MMPIGELRRRLNPQKRSKPSLSEIHALVQEIKYQGITQPVTLSSADGLIESGEERLLAGMHLGMRGYPVNW